ncbi:MAG: Fe-S cluster assembly sulfur transfer protein SufU [Methanobacteriota archaeon]
MPNAADMYQTNILDHYKSPRNFGKLEPSDVAHQEDNPLCGDEVTIYLRLGADDRIDAVMFEGRGCAISQASTSMLTEEVKGKSLQEILKFTKEDILRLLGIPVSPVRMKCAVLGLQTMQAGAAKRVGVPAPMFD